VFALGFVSVFDQVLDGMPEDTDHIFRAYIGALDEDAGKYREDADKLAGWAKELKSASELTPSEDGNDVSLPPPPPSHPKMLMGKSHCMGTALPKTQQFCR